jgi:hypothetical protein
MLQSREPAIPAAAQVLPVVDEIEPISNVNGIANASRSNTTASSDEAPATPPNSLLSSIAEEFSRIIRDDLNELGALLARTLSPEARPASPPLNLLQSTARPPKPRFNVKLVKEMVCAAKSAYLTYDSPDTLRALLRGKDKLARYMNLFPENADSEDFSILGTVNQNAHSIFQASTNGNRVEFGFVRYVPSEFELQLLDRISQGVPISLGEMRRYSTNRKVQIIFRGTRSASDMATDANGLFFSHLDSDRHGIEGRVHTGFLNTFNTASVEILTQLKKYQFTWPERLDQKLGQTVADADVLRSLRDRLNDVKEDIHIDISGHSLGSALAALMTGKIAGQEIARLGDNPTRDQLNTLRDRVSLTAFAIPPLFDERAAFNFRNTVKPFKRDGAKSIVLFGRNNDPVHVQVGRLYDFPNDLVVRLGEHPENGASNLWLAAHGLSQYGLDILQYITEKQSHIPKQIPLIPFVGAGDPDLMTDQLCERIDW